MPTQKKIPRVPRDVELPTPRQRACIQAIQRLRRHGHAPTYTELAAELGITKAGAQTLVATCERKGFVVASRTVVELEVTKAGQRWL